MAPLNVRHFRRPCISSDWISRLSMIVHCALCVWKQYVRLTRQPVWVFRYSDCLRYLFRYLVCLPYRVNYLPCCLYRTVYQPRLPSDWLSRQSVFTSALHHYLHGWRLLGTPSPGMCTYELLGYTRYQIYPVPSKSGDWVMRGVYPVQGVTEYWQVHGKRCYQVPGGGLPNQ